MDEIRKKVSVSQRGRNQAGEASSNQWIWSCDSVRSDLRGGVSWVWLSFSTRFRLFLLLWMDRSELEPTAAASEENLHVPSLVQERPTPPMESGRSAGGRPRTEAPPPQ